MYTPVVVHGPVRRSVRIAITLLLGLVSFAFAFSPAAYGSATGSTTLATSIYEVGENDFLISGPDFNNEYSVGVSALAYNSRNHEYLSVWTRGDRNTDRNGIYGQRLDTRGRELGTNDFRISQRIVDGGTMPFSSEPDVIYNRVMNEYLVVWNGVFSEDPRRSSIRVVYGQRIDAATGERIGQNFRISDREPDGDDETDARNPAVAYNDYDDTYLVVWAGLDTVISQRLDGAGVPVSIDPFVITDRFSEDDKGLDVVYNTLENEYLVVWIASKTNFDIPFVLDTEVFGQRLDGTTGAEIGTPSFRVSDMGPEGEYTYLTYEPVVVHNDQNNEYLVIWNGNDRPEAGSTQIYGQRLDGTTGAEIGVNDFRISNMDNNERWDEYSPSVAYNSDDDEYLVVWGNSGRSDDAYSDNVYGQRLTATGQHIGIDDFLLNDTSNRFAYPVYPSVTYNEQDDEYLVTWSGNDRPLVGQEVFGQRLAIRDDAICDPNRDLWGKVRGVRWVEIGNRSATCSYDVGGAIYTIPSGDPYDPDIDSQQWFDDVTAELGPGERRVLRMDMPSCEAVQVDAFWGEPLRSLDGQRYGERLLAASRFVTGGDCGTVTTSLSGPYPAPES